MTSSTITNTLTLKFRTKSEGYKKYSMRAPLNDGEWHKIIFVLNGNEIQVVENCHQLFKQTDYEIDLSPEKHVRVHIGEDYSGNHRFPGKLREFTADNDNSIHLKCSNLEVIMDNPVQTDTETSTRRIERDGSEEHVFPQDPQVGRRLADHNQNDEVNRLEERISFLEDQFRHWKTVVNNFDNRIKKVELHQRGCQLNGRIVSFGEKQQNLLNCSECQCSSTGELHCGPIGCPPLKCAHPVKIHNECCPKCGEQCYYSGRYYENGEEFWPKQCVRCFCHNGKMDCQFRNFQHCPQITCQPQEIPPNQCCPVCTNIDYCADGRKSCDANAICTNEQYGPKCTCKQGFFGNGTICYDIDECQWDQNARDQLGGCQTGTMCINLPGSFKCDCLPGFQKLDDKNCLDIIRI
uniref:Uncharacterized protein n=2 Tax=Acrobeloides nanus TaxID=290746 RepID=A0A914D618_9BILA